MSRQLHIWRALVLRGVPMTIPARVGATVGATALAVVALVLLMKSPGPNIANAPATDSFTLPDGGAWPLAPDAAILPIDGTCGSVAGLQTCTVATPTGYASYQVMVPALPDGGPSSTGWIYNSTQAFTCRCAKDATCTWVADGGPVPLTGTYAAALVTGAGCLARSCFELSGFTGTPTGCLP